MQIPRTEHAGKRNRSEGVHRSRRATSDRSHRFQALSHHQRTFRSGFRRAISTCLLCSLRFQVRQVGRRYEQLAKVRRMAIPTAQRTRPAHRTFPRQAARTDSQLHYRPGQGESNLRLSGQNHPLREHPTRHRRFTAHCRRRCLPHGIRRL